MEVGLDLKTLWYSQLAVDEAVQIAFDVSTLHGLTSSNLRFLGRRSLSPGQLVDLGSGGPRGAGDRRRGPSRRQLVLLAGLVADDAAAQGLFAQSDLEQPPPAVQVVASVADHVSVDDP